MMMESQGWKDGQPKDWPEKSMHSYVKLIAENKLDTATIKRKVALYRTCDQIEEAVKLLIILLKK